MTKELVDRFKANGFIENYGKTYLFKTRLNENVYPCRVEGAIFIYEEDFRIVFEGDRSLEEPMMKEVHNILKEKTK